MRVKLHTDPLTFLKSRLAQDCASRQEGGHTFPKHTHVQLAVLQSHRSLHLRETQKVAKEVRVVARDPTSPKGVAKASRVERSALED